MDKWHELLIEMEALFGVDDDSDIKDYKITMVSETGSIKYPVIIREADGAVTVTTGGTTKTHKIFPVEVNISAGETVIQGGVKNLRCSCNNLTAIDISECRSLETLDCYNNKLTEIDLLDSRKLLRLDCSRNNLKELDAVLCPDLCHLNVKKNDFTSRNLDKIVTGLMIDSNVRYGTLKLCENGAALLGENGKRAMAVLKQRGWTVEILNISEAEMGVE